MRHLDADERLALIEAGDGPAHPHLATCGRCRAEVAEIRAALEDARSVNVPEPSPLFWDGLSRRIFEEIASAGRGPEPSRWPFWRVLFPLVVGVAALLIAVGTDRSSRPGPAAPAPAAATIERGSAPSDDLADDEQWTLLGHLAADFDLETLSDSLGSLGADGADDAVWQLSERERAELAVLLRAELQQQP